MHRRAPKQLEPAPRLVGRDMPRSFFQRGSLITSIGMPEHHGGVLRLLAPPASAARHIRTSVAIRITTGFPLTVEDESVEGPDAEKPYHPPLPRSAGDATDNSREPVRQYMMVSCPSGSTISTVNGQGIRGFFAEHDVMRPNTDCHRAVRALTVALRRAKHRRLSEPTAECTAEEIHRGTTNEFGHKGISWTLKQVQGAPIC